MKHIWAAFGGLFLLASAALAQGGSFNDVTLKSTAAQGGATVRVCTEAATGTPCSPLATIYSDAALSTAKTNPTTSDARGNFSLYAVPNSYKLQISGSGIVTYEYVVTIPGPEGATLALVGADWCAKVANAITSLPSTGGTVDATGLEGSQSCAASLTINKKTTLLLGSGTIALGTSQILITSPGVHIIGKGQSATSLTYSGTGTAIDGATTAGNNNTVLQGFLLTTSNNAGGGIKLGNSNQGSLISDVKVQGTGAANTGIGLLLDGTGTAFSGQLALTNFYALQFKYGMKVTGGAVGLDSWTTTTCTNCFFVQTGSPAGSIGIWITATGNMVGSAFLGGTVEDFEVGIQVDNGGGTGVDFHVDNEANTTPTSFAASWVGTYNPLNANATLYDSTKNVKGTNGKFSTYVAIDGATLTNTNGLFFKGTAQSLVITDDTGAGTSKMIIQAGAGSAAHGGGLSLYQHSHATFPGWVTAGISSGSGGKFSVNTQGNGAGTNVFTVDTSGNTVANGNLTATNGSLTLSQTGGIIGTTTNNSANAGSVGEYIPGQRLIASALSLTTNVVANITSIPLTAGDWDVSGSVDFIFGATTNYTELAGGISTTSATFGPQGQAFDFSSQAAGLVPVNTMSFVTPTVRISVAGTTTVYLVAFGTFTVSTLNGAGTISARRVR